MLAGSSTHSARSSERRSLPSSSDDLLSISTAKIANVQAITTKCFQFGDKWYYGVNQEDLTLLGSHSKYLLLSEVQDRIGILAALLEDDWPLIDGWAEEATKDQHPPWKPNVTSYKYFHRNNARIIVALQGFYTSSDATGLTRELLSFSRNSTIGRSTSWDAIQDIEDSWLCDATTKDNLWRRNRALYSLMKKDGRWKSYCSFRGTTQSVNGECSIPPITYGDSPSLMNDVPQARRHTSHRRQYTTDHRSVATSTSVTDSKSAASTADSLNLRDLLYVQTDTRLRKEQIVDALRALRDELQRSGTCPWPNAIGAWGAFLKDDDWEGQLPPFNHKTRQLYARLGITALRLRYGLLHEDGVQHILESMTLHDLTKVGVETSPQGRGNSKSSRAQQGHADPLVAI